MSKSLRIKLAFILLLIIILLMTVVLAFLVRGVQDFYTDQFFNQMQSVVMHSELVPLLTNAAGEEESVAAMAATLAPFSGLLGIDGMNRNYYILDGATGVVLETSNPAEGVRFEITYNIMRAMLGEEGVIGRARTAYMDIAIPILTGGSEVSYIVYIIDNKQTVQSLTSEVFTLIVQSLLIGFAVAIVISLIISGTVLSPIHGMTKAAKAMSDGDFSSKINVESEDELGILALTFNDMASQIESMLEELKNSERLRREFVANVSHELRTPLTSIRTYAETLAENPRISKRMHADYLDVIINESDRMTKIVRDLLDLSRFDADDSILSYEEFSLELSIRSVYAAIALEADKRGHIMNLELEWKLPKVVGDRARLEQVLINIISNALKYTPDGGMIDVISGSKGDIVWVEISDTGVGIPAEDLEHVFDRFYRVDKARSRESGGTGLGLAIAKDIVMLHGGDIKINSTPGVGTTVRISLPLLPPTIEAQSVGDENEQEQKDN